MRNVWHHKGVAEYMTKKRFGELGLTEAAIGVRDRSFGTQMLVEQDAKAAKKAVAEDGLASKKKETVTMAVCNYLLQLSEEPVVCGGVWLWTNGS
jgi:hypothetical protein